MRIFSLENRIISWFTRKLERYFNFIQEGENGRHLQCRRKDRHEVVLSANQSANSDVTNRVPTGETLRPSIFTNNADRLDCKKFAQNVILYRNQNISYI